MRREPLEKEAKGQNVMLFSQLEFFYFTHALAGVVRVFSVT
jgi:hypothetical protein